MASLDEHQAIMEAIAQGDGEAAGTAMRAHFDVQGARIADLLAGLEQGSTTSKPIGTRGGYTAALLGPVRPSEPRRGTAQ